MRANNRLEQAGARGPSTGTTPDGVAPDKEVGRFVWGDPFARCSNGSRLCRAVGRTTLAPGWSEDTDVITL